RELCDRHNVLLIFDEIITGVGRTGRLFAAETFGVVPDVLCTAKGLAGGYAPLSAMICRESIGEAFWGPISENPGFVEGHTFEGNPISCAAGLAVLREILERDLCANARARGEQLRAGFQRLARKYGVIGDVRGKGLFQGIEFVPDLKTTERFQPGQEVAVRIGRRALEYGLLGLFDPAWLAAQPMEMSDDNVAVLQAVVAVLARLGIPYALGGSWASSLQGKMRLTQDADLTVEPFPGKEAVLVGSFGEDYYVSLAAAEE